MPGITMPGMVDENDRARRVFERFLKTHNISARSISAAAGLSPSAASQFIRGNAKSPRGDTMRAFARGAGKILGRPVPIYELFLSDLDNADAVFVDRKGNVTIMEVKATDKEQLADWLLEKVYNPAEMPEGSPERLAVITLVKHLLRTATKRDE